MAKEERTIYTGASWCTIYNTISQNKGTCKVNTKKCNSKNTGIWR